MQFIKETCPFKKFSAPEIPTLSSITLSWNITRIWDLFFHTSLLLLKHFGGSSSSNSIFTVGCSLRRSMSAELFTNLQSFTNTCPITFFCMRTYRALLCNSWKVTFSRISSPLINGGLYKWSEYTWNLIASPIPRVSLPPIKKLSLTTSDWLLAIQKRTSFRQILAAIRTPILLLQKMQSSRNTLKSASVSFRFGGPLATNAYP